MFSNPLKKLKRFLSSALPVVPCEISYQKAIDGDALIVTLDPDQFVMLWPQQGTWHATTAIPDSLGVRQFTEIENTGAPASANEDVLAVLVATLVAGIGLTRCGVDDAGSLRVIPGYTHNWSAFRERVLTCVAYVHAAARGQTQAMRTLNGPSSHEVARNSFGTLLDSFPTLFTNSGHS